MFVSAKAGTRNAVLERYELLYEAGLVEEFYRDSGQAGRQRRGAWERP